MRYTTWIVALAVLVALPAVAETPSGTLRVLLSSASPQGDWSGVLDVGGMTVDTTVEAQSTTGFGILYEVRVNGWLGIESGLYFADFDFEIRALGQSADFGSALAIPLTLGADFHPYSGERVDVYVGPLVHYTLWGDLETTVGTVSVDGDFGVGAVAGIDISLGSSGWIVSAGVRYLSTAVSDSTVEVDVNPLFAEIGLGYQF